MCRSFLKRFYLFTSRERGRAEEREGEKHQCVVASHMPPTGDLAHYPVLCPGLGIEPVNLWHSIHCATPARCRYFLLAEEAQITSIVSINKNS